MLSFIKIFHQRSQLWHTTCFEKPCQFFDYCQKFINLIPNIINPADQQSVTDFTRKRKLTFPKLITFILYLSVSGKSAGVDIKSGIFFNNARRNGLWPEATAVHRSAVTKARPKVPWTIFQDLLGDAVKVAYQSWPDHEKYLWHGRSVVAIDGSKYTLPASAELRAAFDPHSGLQYSGKGHYPQCLVSTLYDVFRRLPLARHVGPVHTSERDAAIQLLPFIPANSLLLLDRGYPGYDFIRELQEKFSGHFLMRCPARYTFPAVERFVHSNKNEDIIYLKPSNKSLDKLNSEERKNLRPIKIRVIRLTSPEGSVSVLLTNLFNRKSFHYNEFIALYSRRLEVETYYRDEKIVLDIDKFHGQTVNSIKQELLAAAIMSVISRTLMVLSSDTSEAGAIEPQFKNAIMTLASEAAVLAPEDPEAAVIIFDDILQAILRVKYYRPKRPRPPAPRVTKRAINKWATARLKKVANA